MENLDINKLLEDMLNAAKGEFNNYWKEVKPYAETEFKSFVENLALIGRLKLQGKMTEEKALIHIDMQKNSMRMVFLTIEGLGLLTIQNAINAVIDVIKSTVNTAIGWTIL